MISTPYLLLDLNSQNAAMGSRAAHTLLPCSRVLLASLELLAIPEAARGDNEALVPLSMEPCMCPEVHACVCWCIWIIWAVCMSLWVQSPMVLVTPGPAAALPPTNGLCLPAGPSPHSSCPQHCPAPRAGTGTQACVCALSHGVGHLWVCPTGVTAPGVCCSGASEHPPVRQCRSLPLCHPSVCPGLMRVQLLCPGMNSSAHQAVVPCAPGCQHRLCLQALLCHPLCSHVGAPIPTPPQLL